MWMDKYHYLIFNLGGQGMNKRVLGKLPVAELTVSEAAEIYANKKKDINGKRDEIKYTVEAEIIHEDKKRILLLNFFNQRALERGNRKAEFRVFQTHDDYITQDFNEAKPKWRTGSLQNILQDCGYYWYMGKSYLKAIEVKDNKSIKALKEFFVYIVINEKVECELEKVFILQMQIMKERLCKKHKAITDKIDEVMDQVPEIPNDFISWVDEVAFFNSKYIYYKYKPTRKSIEGYCTHCKTDVKIIQPKHNKKAICPNCRQEITYKVLGKSHNVKDYGQAAIIQKVGERLLVRSFSMKKIYDEHYREPKIYCDELKRMFITEDGEITGYEYTEFKQTGNVRWCDNEFKYSFNSQALYERNLEVLKNTRWKYSAIKEYATNEPGFKFSAMQYLATYIKYPMLEYLVKLRLYRIANGLMNFSWINRDVLNLKGKNITEILKVNKSYLPILQRINASTPELELIQRVTNRGINITEEQIKYIDEQLIRTETILKLLDYVSLNKLLRYIKKQATPEHKAKDIAIEYQDYLINCEKLKYDLKNEFILFPKDLIEAHNQVSDLVIEQKNKKYDIAIKKMHGDLNKTYSWEWKDYRVIVPSGAMEIVHEGQRLHHCVGSYLDRVAKKETVILFLRKKENVESSYYTMEVRKGEIIQCRGMSNKSYDEVSELIKVINKFKRDRLLPLKEIRRAV